MIDDYDVQRVAQGRGQASVAPLAKRPSGANSWTFVSDKTRAPRQVDSFFRNCLEMKMNPPTKIAKFIAAAKPSTSAFSLVLMIGTNMNEWMKNQTTNQPTYASHFISTPLALRCSGTRLI